MYFLFCVTNGFVAVGEIIGIFRRSAVSPPASVLPEIISPIIATTFSFSMSLETAFADSTLSDFVSTSLTSTGRPRTSGCIFLAIEMPSHPICPYAATFPVMDKYAPKTMGSAAGAEIAKDRAKTVEIQNDFITTSV
jgi:hypothetical protein